MSLDLANRLAVFLASAPQNVHAVQTLSISHSALPRTYYLWSEPYQGLILVDGAYRPVEMLNMEIKLAGSDNNLDQRFEIRIDTTDVADEFREAMDAIPHTTLEVVRITYREYLSDDLDTPQATSALQVESVSWLLGAASITAVSPRLSITRTGELYSPRDVPMLRSFL